MGRLTKRINAEIAKGLTYEAIIYKDIEHHETDFNYKALEKLAHYEDMEEQGRLIEVVRCKECWRYDTGAGYDGWGLCELYDQDRKDNDYCSFGELKELEGDKE